MFENLINKTLVQVQPVFASADWSLDSFFQNVLIAVQKYGGYILMIVGAAALIWSIVQAFRKYVFQSQEVRTGAVALIAGAVFGAAFMIGGWDLANNIGQGLKETADEFGGNGTSLPMFIEAIKFHLPFK